MTDLERQATATHQAAHAVASHILGGRPVTRVTIVAGDGFLGCVDYKTRTGDRVVIPEQKPVGWPVIGLDARTRRRAESGIVITMAGDAAERAYCRTDATHRGPADIEVDWARPVSDATAEQEMVLKLLPGIPVDTSVAYYTAITDQVVRSPRFYKLLVALTSELFERETLTGDEVRRILSTADADHYRKGSDGDTEQTD